MIKFEHIEYLWLLAGVAVLGAGILLTAWHRRRRMKRWADEPMLPRLVPDQRIWRPVTKTILLLLGISFLIVALANPMKGSKMEKGKRSGSDIAICLDVSNSMMAEDLKPNRLARSKQAVNSLLNTMTGDRVSLVVFAGTSFIEMPLTNDYNAAKLFLEQVDCNMVTTQGTAIGDAIETAMATFGYGDEEREWKTNNSRAIIIISDGENHEDDAKSAAKKAADQGVRVCTIGMGTTDPTPIPTKKNGSYLRDHNGNVVITRLNEQMLRDIADAGKGIYVHGGSSMGEISNLLETLQKNEFDEAIFNSFESHYRIPLIAGLLCLLVELLIFERRSKRWRALLPLLLLLGGTAQGQTPLVQFYQGNTLYRQGQYLEAANQYSNILKDTALGNGRRAKVLYNLGNCLLELGRESDDKQTLATAARCYNEALATHHSSPFTTPYSPLTYKLNYNLANALYLQEKYDSAAAQYNATLGCKGLTDGQRSRTMYNMGNSFLKLAQQSRDTATLRTAIDCYRNALRLEPQNADYRYNQTLAYRLFDKWTKRNRQQNKQDQQKQDQQKQDQQKQDQQKQDQQKQEQQKQEQQKQEQQKSDQKQQQQQSEQQKKEQKKQEDSKNLDDKVKQELQRQQQKKQQEQQKQKQKQQDNQQNQQQQNGQKQQDQQQNGQKQQDQQQNGQKKQDQQQSNQKSGQQQQKDARNDDNKQSKQQLNDEIKKELERQKQKGEEQSGKGEKKEGQQKEDPQKKDEQSKDNGNKAQDHADNWQKRQQQAAQRGDSDKEQQPNAQQATMTTAQKGASDKKNAENLLEAVRNNERATIKAQIIKAQQGNSHRVEKEW